MATLSGGDALQRRLAEIAASMGGGSVSVGFMSGAVYPDGTPVAGVAYWNEYGQAGQPARPFFRRMIATESPGWALKMAAAARATNYDGQKVLDLMGEDIAGALKESISNLTDPPLAQSTIDAKGSSKPLIETSDMKNSITHEVFW